MSSDNTTELKELLRKASEHPTQDGLDLFTGTDSGDTLLAYILATPTLEDKPLEFIYQLTCYSRVILKKPAAQIDYSVLERIIRFCDEGIQKTVERPYVKRRRLIELANFYRIRGISRMRLFEKTLDELVGAQAYEDFSNSFQYTLDLDNFVTAAIDLRRQSKLAWLLFKHTDNVWWLESEFRKAKYCTDFIMVYDTDLAFAANTVAVQAAWYMIAYLKSRKPDKTEQDYSSWLNNAVIVMESAISLIKNRNLQGNDPQQNKLLAEKKISPFLEFILWYRAGQITTELYHFKGDANYAELAKSYYLNAKGILEGPVSPVSVDYFTKNINRRIRNLAKTARI